MTNGRGRGILERDAASDLWRRTLSQIPSLFGRLVYLSSIRNMNTGRYEHHGLAQRCGEEEADAALRGSHGQAFSEWLTYGLEQQKADIDLYLSAFGADKGAVIDTWTKLMPYKNLIPASAAAAERNLYLVDFETILDVLRAEYGVACPAPDA